MKISNDKAAFATFYADERNKNKWWTPTATPENPLVEVLLTVMLSGALVRLANGGSTPYKMWKAAREMVGEASAGVSKDDMALIQDFMMAVSQLKASTTEGGDTDKNTSNELRVFATSETIRQTALVGPE